ncbi:MAG: hypothetical protein EXR91_08240 [Gemmatimonadetes bacterium]|nr:hypothetical protein [Gemmatimonadota bacterium]
MGPEMWVALLAVFVSGGAIGTAGTLLSQWLLKRFDASASPPERLDVAEVEVLRSEVADLGRHLQNLDARLDFTERLLDGGLPVTPAPARITGSEPDTAGTRPSELRPSAS